MKQETIKILNAKHKCLPLTYTANKTNTSWAKKKKWIHHESPKYNLNLPLSTKTQKLPLSTCINTPPFCDKLPTGNQDSSSKGGGKEECRTLAKSARKA